MEFDHSNLILDYVILLEIKIAFSAKKLFFAQCVSIPRRIENNI